MLKSKIGSPRCYHTISGPFVYRKYPFVFDCFPSGITIAHAPAFICKAALLLQQVHVCILGEEARSAPCTGVSVLAWSR